MLTATQNTTSLWRRAWAKVSFSFIALTRQAASPWFPPEANTLKTRLQVCLNDYEAYIKRRNAEAEDKERTIAKLNTEIELIDDDITEVEIYADTLKRLLEEL